MRFLAAAACILIATIVMSTGTSSLSFPDTPLTIVPRDPHLSIVRVAKTNSGRHLLIREGEDGRLEVRLPSKAGAWDDLALRWSDSGDWFQAGVGGGLYFATTNGQSTRAEQEAVEITTDGKSVVYSGKLTHGNLRSNVNICFRLIGKSLVMDIQAKGGHICEARFGSTRGLVNPRLVTIPYYTYNGYGGGSERPFVIVSGDTENPLFFMAHVDWTQSNASSPFSGGMLFDGTLASNGGTRYEPKTDGQRNPCFERFVLTLSPRFEDVLPNIPNPPSPWRHVTGTRVWRAHGTGGRDRDAAYWRDVHRWGMRQLVVTDHETGWRDIPTSVTTWSRVDYDARVPGAATFAAVFYSYGEIMLIQKKTWNGPVYSEGPNHFMYCGLTDGNYAQDQSYRISENPWLVDFDLLRMHDLCCNFGMGNPEMFYPHKSAPPDAETARDRFLAATVAFGHPGFLLYGRDAELRSYYMLQALASLYTQSSADAIRYVAADGSVLDSSAAVAAGVHERSQILTRYADGTVTAVNGNPRERMRLNVDGQALDLPPNGYWGRSADNAVRVISGDLDGRRFDLSVSPDYTYIDGRGVFTRLPEGASMGVAICRVITNDLMEVLLHKTSEAGFPFTVGEAVALDKTNAIVGIAEVRYARGLSYVLPVKNAFSYCLRRIPQPPQVLLDCDKDTVLPGERVLVRGRREHVLDIPKDVKPGDRLWYALEQGWIDFTVAVPKPDSSIAGDLRLTP